MADGNLPVESKPTKVPELSEMAQVLETGLRDTFSNVEVSVVDCPDLTEKPWSLAAPGICGQPRLADVGGPPYLIPLPTQEKIGRYDMADIATACDLEGGFVFGAGAASSRIRGVNCEMIPNNLTSSKDKLLSYSAKVAENGTDCVLEDYPYNEFSLLANLCITKGEPGKVVKVTASNRTGDKNFVTAMRLALAGHYGDAPVGVGGVFQIEAGSAKLHVMPAFSDTPLQSDKDVEDWLMFYDAPSPLTCLSTFVSHDPGLDLRVEHTHCFSHHGDGGHYHYDVTPKDVRYVGYFVPVERIYRVDRPTATHTIGRD